MQKIWTRQTTGPKDKATNKGHNMTIPLATQSIATRSFVGST